MEIKIKCVSGWVTVYGGDIRKELRLRGFEYHLLTWLKREKQSLGIKNGQVVVVVNYK